MLVDNEYIHGCAAWPCLPAAARALLVTCVLGDCWESAENLSELRSLVGFIETVILWDRGQHGCSESCLSCRWQSRSLNPVLARQVGRLLLPLPQVLPRCGVPQSLLGAGCGLEMPQRSCLRSSTGTGTGTVPSAPTRRVQCSLLSPSAFLSWLKPSPFRPKDLSNLNLWLVFCPQD